MRRRNWKEISHESSDRASSRRSTSAAGGGSRSACRCDSCGSRVHCGPGVCDGRAGPPVSVYTARGPVSQSVVIGTPKSVTATKTVRVRVKGKVVTRKVSFTYQTVTPLMSCGEATACDTAYQQLTIPPGGYTGWHTHPGPTFVAVAQGEGTLYHGMSGCPSFKYAVGAGFMQPPTEVHNMRNEGSTPLVLWAFYALPPGTAERRDPH